MNFKKILKLNSLMKEKSIAPDKLLEFIQKLDNDKNLEQASLFIDSLNIQGRPKYSTPEESLTEHERQTIEAELKQNLFSRIHQEIAELLKTAILNHPILIQGVLKNIHQGQEKIKKLSPLLNHIVDNYSDNYRYSNRYIHPTLSIGFNFSPDTTIETIKIPAQKITLSSIDLDEEYVGMRDQIFIYKNLYNSSLDQPAIFYKNLSLLQLFSRFGLDDLIEKSIKYGANIHYKESTENLTALDFYNTYKSSLIPTNLSAYTISLLDGSYQNGHYQTLYEKKKLEKEIDSPLDSQKNKKAFKL